MVNINPFLATGVYMIMMTKQGQPKKEWRKKGEQPNQSIKKLIDNTLLDQLEVYQGKSMKPVSQGQSDVQNS